MKKSKLRSALICLTFLGSFALVYFEGRSEGKPLVHSKLARGTSKVSCFCIDINTCITASSGLIGCGNAMTDCGLNDAMCNE
jgi:hypothetical protein